MTAIRARRARLADGWAEDVRIVLAEDRIQAVEAGVPGGAADVAVDTLLPALSNLHSHAFQRAMAGMTEHRGPGQDSFWTWRELMYRFLDHLTPEDVEAIAALAFMEMLEAGYAAVGEFHYVHHQPGGAAYDDPAELSARIFAAAEQTGIGLTHLPVLYSYGGAGQEPVAGGQARFFNTPDGYLRLVEAIRGHLGAMPGDTRMGLAPHSLRATAPEDLDLVLRERGGAPVHIHIAEQPREVEEISAWLRARPVEWLLGHAEVGADWCLIHATHMTEAETEGLARSGAVAGLCPLTEANLGDGPFNGAVYLGAGGRFGVGTDSNVCISVFGELRMLEYSQRLRDLARNVLAGEAGSVGETLYLGAASCGAQALGREAGAIRVGVLADLVAVDTGGPALCGLETGQILDGLCFAAPESAVTDVWSAGRHCVREGRHVARERIVPGYVKCLKSLVGRL